MKTLKIPCAYCKKEVTIKVDEAALNKWKSGVHVQDAFPKLSAADREMFISQTCDDCWNKIFGDTKENPKKKKVPIKEIVAAAKTAKKLGLDPIKLFKSNIDKYPEDEAEKIINAIEKIVSKKNPHGMIEFNSDIMQDAIKATEHRFHKPIGQFQKEEFDYLWKLYGKANDSRISLKIYPERDAADFDDRGEITLPEITRPLEIIKGMNPHGLVKTKADEAKWRRAVRSAERKFKKKEKSFGERQWRYVMGAFKKMKNI